MSTITQQEAGHRLKTLRLALKLSQREAGDRARPPMPHTQVSRIEKGTIDNVKMVDLIRYGQVLGLSPNEIATIYGYWNGTERAAEDDPHLVQLRQLMRGMSPSDRRWMDNFLDWVLEEVRMHLDHKRKP